MLDDYLKDVEGFRAKEGIRHDLNTPYRHLFAGADRKLRTAHFIFRYEMSDCALLFHYLITHLPLATDRTVPLSFSNVNDALE